MERRTVRKGDVMKREGMLVTFEEFDRMQKVEDALRECIETGAWFYKNCKIQRRKGAKICNTCPFRTVIEATE
jgi:hypothetical protein